MSQDVQIQVDVARTNSNNQRSNYITVYNNSPLGNKMGNPVNEDATSLENSNTVRLNSYYNAFENLNYNDTLTFTLTNYTNAQNYPNKCLKFEIVDVLDSYGYSIYHELKPNNSISYVKMYDGTNPVSGTLTLSNILVYEDYTNIFIKAAVTIVDYDYTIFECDNYKIKEYTEAEYTKNTYGASFALVEGMMGYYYYLEMGQYPQDYAGDEINNALNAVYGSEDDLIYNGLAIENQIVPINSNQTLKLTLYQEDKQSKFYNQVLYTKYVKPDGTEGVGYKVCPIYWFEEINSRQLDSNGISIKGTGDIYARSQVYAHEAIYYYKDINTLVDQTVDTYAWFKVMPTKWIIYSLENGDANTIPSGSANSQQLKTITNALKNNIKFKVYAEVGYDISCFNSLYGSNNWATSYIRANLNGTTGSTIKKYGSSTTTLATNMANPFTFNSKTLNQFINNNMTVFSNNEKTASPFIDNVFNNNQQNYIAITKNKTYFNQDKYNENNLNPDMEDSTPTTNPLYSETQEKLYLLSADFDGEINSIGEYNLENLNKTSNCNDYLLAHNAKIYYFSSTNAIQRNYCTFLRSATKNRTNVVTRYYVAGTLYGDWMDRETASLRPAFHFQAF